MCISNRDHYLTAVSWIDDQSLVTVWMEREQNYAVISICSESNDWTCEKVCAFVENIILKRMKRLESNDWQILTTNFDFQIFVIH
jgi:hypothetical protein